MIKKLDEHPAKTEEDRRRDLALRLRSYREMHDLTQDDLAKRIGISKRQLIRWEKAERTPQKPQIRILKDLGILKEVD